MNENLLNGKLPLCLNIYLVECCRIYSAVDFSMFSTTLVGVSIEVSDQYVSSLT